MVRDSPFPHLIGRCRRITLAHLSHFPDRFPAAIVIDRKWSLRINRFRRFRRDYPNSAYAYLSIEGRCHDYWPGRGRHPHGCRSDRPRGCAQPGEDSHGSPPTCFARSCPGSTTSPAGVDPGRIERVVFSTTLTTNAIIEGNVPAVGMIVSAGPGLDPDLFAHPRGLCVVSGAIDHRGRESGAHRSGPGSKARPEIQGKRHPHVGRGFQVFRAQPVPRAGDRSHCQGGFRQGVPRPPDFGQPELSPPDRHDLPQRGGPPGSPASFFQRFSDPWKRGDWPCRSGFSRRTAAT